MKKITLLAVITIFLIACKGEKEENKPINTETDTEVVSQNERAEVEKKQEKSANFEKFDIEKLPISDKNIGDFPFFSTPEGTIYRNNTKPKDFDFIVFTTPHEIFEVEGKTFRADIGEDEKSSKEASSRYLFKSYENAILKAGGVKVFEGKLEGERQDQYKEICTYAGSDGSIDIWNETVVAYAIHRNDGNIYIMIEKPRYSAHMAIQIVQEKGFEQTIEYIQSDKIKKDLEEKGKSVLHINFDTDKATLKPDGINAVNEIVKVLKEVPEMKIEINGYTDNTGASKHNLELSKKRALAVKNIIEIAGIDTSRLQSNGYGQEEPIADNSTEEGKAKNRRVELVKF